MPRQPRQRSKSDTYHIMLRGINRQCIFGDDDDYIKFLELLVKHKEGINSIIYAYCLMSNHVHLLIKSDNISSYISKIASGYVYWYNWKYNRIGGLFQDRFKSEVVDNDDYLLAVLRYIHQNPINAGITDNIGEYKYSSYNCFVNSGKSNIVDVAFISGLLSQKQFIVFHKKPSSEIHIEINNVRRINDDDARRIIKNICNVENLVDISALEFNCRKSLLRAIKKEGLTVRQIERLTGLNRGTIFNA